MFSDNRKQVKDIFQATLDCPPDERERFLADACGGDAELRAEVRQLFDSFDNGGGFTENAETKIAGGNSQKIEIGQRLGHFTIAR